MNPGKISASVQQRVREAAGNRCGYCLSPQKYVLGKLEIDHLLPRSEGGRNDESNLWLSCSFCNRFKGSQVNAIDPLEGTTVALYKPRTQIWSEHFRWSPDGTLIIGRTAIGRATVEALRLNYELAIEVRRNWILAGWYPLKLKK